MNLKSSSMYVVWSTYKITFGFYFKSYSYKHGFPGEDDSEADELEYEDELDGGASSKKSY